ncbi:unnamed protein product [Gongylonema pulchrum]|uniref:Chitin-binding type-2 domain-containing protein n=1 Tax=Gongylonema pulchrum TaxID=637853 RepID=A0A183D982_9BILA|nr:unnamed protein product [Gongylonema pulchrum]
MTESNPESGGPSGYRADPLDCKKFYQCAQGKWVSKKCPAALFWNPEKSVCDWPRNVSLCKQHDGAAAATSTV